MFQMTRVSSALLQFLCGVQRLAPPKTVRLHLTAQVTRIWRGSVTDGNVTIFPEADATHMDLLSGATWSASRCRKVSDSEGCIDLRGPVPAMPDISPPDKKSLVLTIARALQRCGWTPVHREVTTCPWRAHGVLHFEIEQPPPLPPVCASA